MLKSGLFGRRTTTTFRRTPRAPAKVCPVCHELECLCRPRYFAGQLLTDDDLNAEQQYVIRKNQLHNLYLHGWGVVCGLQVVCHDSCAGWVTLEQGYAISPCGDDIVVCESKDFDVIAAIDECLRRRAQADPIDCTPRGNNKADCDPDGVWCLTIRYHETASRAITSLRSGTEGGTKACTCGPADPCSCGCGASGSRGGATAHGSSGHGGCSCGARSSSRCRCGTGATAAATPSAARGPMRPECEPTRWCEGYELELCQRVDDSDRTTYRDLLGGTLFGNLYECFSDIAALMARPDEEGTADERYVQFSTMQSKVQHYLATHHSTRCDLLDAAGAVSVEPPSKAWLHVRPEGAEAAAAIAGGAVAGPATATAWAYHASVDAAVTAVHNLLWTLFMECVCLQLLPPCPTDPGDDRLTLACIRVKGGKIVEICNFERKQVVTFPAILWWLSALPIGPIFGQLLEQLCCGDAGAMGLSRLLDERVAPVHAGLMGQPADATVLREQLGQVIRAATRNASAGFFPGGTP